MASPISNGNVQILVVDDEPDLRTLYELTLLREGYRVEAAESLAQAWQQLQSRRFDVIITDMRLPDGLGMELLQKVREQQRPERCVVITAYGSADNAVESLKAGAFDYLTKPVDLRQFREREPEAARRLMQDVAALHRDGRIQPLMAARFAMTQHAQAFALAMARDTVGRVLLLP